MKIFNICEYGAKIDDSIQTNAIQNALDACFLAGGGRVVVPSGIFHTGGIRLRSNTELYLESGAVLKGSTDPEDYNSFWNDTLEPVTDEDDGKASRSAIATSRWCNGLIRVLDAENVSIIGEKGSYIDGVNCFDAMGEEGYRGPHPISVWRCKNLYLEGYTITDGGNWGHAIFKSQNITIRNVSVYGGHDGIDVRTCDNILIENCTLHTGDDCVAGFDNHDVVIRNCSLQSSCQLFRFGGNNVLIENCVSHKAGFGFRGHLSDEKKRCRCMTDETCRHIAHTAFTYYCDFRAQIRKTPGDILVRNCSFAESSYLFGLMFDGAHKWCTNRSLSSITFENCSFADLMETGCLYGDKDEKVTFVMRNCTISKKDGVGDFPILECTNFEKIRFENVLLEGFEEPSLLICSEGITELVDTSLTLIQKK